MRDRLVRLGHAVRVVLLLDGVAAIVGGVEHLAREAVGHRLLAARARSAHNPADGERAAPLLRRSEEHTSELQSQSNLVCRLLLEKKKNKINKSHIDEQQYRRLYRAHYHGN